MLLGVIVASSSIMVVSAAQATRLTLQVPSVVYAGDGVNMTALLTDASGSPIFGWLTWYLNNAEIGEGLGTVISLGRWPTVPGDYTIKVVFNGTSDYESTQAQAILTVLQATYSLTTSSHQLTSSTNQGQPVTIQVQH